MLARRPWREHTYVKCRAREIARAALGYAFFWCILTNLPAAELLCADEQAQGSPAQTEEGQSVPDQKEGDGRGGQNNSPGVRLGVADISLDSAGQISLGGIRGESADARSMRGKPAKRYELVGAPIPMISPTTGNGIAGAGAIAIQLDKNDKRSPPSIFGAGAAFTSNGTYGWGVLSELFLTEDRFRILTVFGKGRVNYDYYGTGSESGDQGLFLPIHVNALVFIIEPKVRLFERWYAGPRYRLLEGNVAIDLDRLFGEFPDFPSIPGFPEIPDPDFKVRTAALGARVQRDSRDSQFYPRSGSFFDTLLEFHDPAFASQRTYQNIQIGYQGYQGFREKNVIAYRGTVCVAAGEHVPFFDQCSLGQSRDIRGYAVGRYQDRRMIVGQVEYRRELFWRIGAAGFFGVGEVARTFSEFNRKNIRPGGGVGVRFLLAKQNRINLRVDYAWGRGSSALYVSIGEAF